MKRIKDHRPGSAGVTACPRDKNQRNFIEWSDMFLVPLDAGRRGRLRSQDDVALI
jgi:hypothetical protein